MMKIVGPERYRLRFDSHGFSSTCTRGTPTFSGISVLKLPKLYIASKDHEPVYVGVTRQPMRNRLRLGWNAKGETGYYGYAWRHKMAEADLDVWVHEDPPDISPARDMETVEAEIVHLIRCAGQWPRYQTEIHFHPSTTEHRAAAESIYSLYSKSG